MKAYVLATRDQKVLSRVVHGRQVGAREAADTRNTWDGKREGKRLRDETEARAV